MTAILELSGISKNFGALQALDSVSLSIGRGEIHALLGENGAGKTTLMNVVFGLLRPDTGTISFDGRAYSSMTPQIAMSLGIGMVHQHFKLVDEFTVAENVALGSPDHREALPPRNGSRLDQVIRQSGFKLDPNARVDSLPLGARQQVEILKALFRGAKLLILDEPTAVLTPGETDELFRALEQLRDRGTSIVIITHKLREALAISSQLTVLRAGPVIITGNADGMSESSLATAMVGRSLDRTPRPRKPTGDDVLLSLTGVSYTPVDGQPLRGVSASVRAGEILGIAGVEGNGQRALVETLVGLAPPAHGSIRLCGHDVTRRNLVQRLRIGLSHIPGDRHQEGLLLDFSLKENVLLTRWPDPEFHWGQFVRLKNLTSKTSQIIREFDIRGGSPGTSAMSLSGGNQQRLVIGRQLDARPRVLVAVNPTRGLDVGAIDYVHDRILDHRNGGGATVLISSDLDEILNLADRVAVLFGGAIAGEYGPDTPREIIGLAMAGSAAGAA